MNKIWIDFIIDFKKKAPLAFVSFFKSEGFKIGAIAFLCLFGIAKILPSFLDNSKLKFDLTQRLSKLTQATISIKGDIEIDLLPSPSISAHHVFIENYAPPSKRDKSDNFYNIYVRDLKIVFPIFRINSGKLIEKVIADRAIIEVAQPEALKKIVNSSFSATLERVSKNIPDSQKNIASKGGISSKLFPINDIESVAIGLSINPSIQITDSTITFYNEYGISKEFTKIDSIINYGEDVVEGYGNFMSQSIENEFRILAKFDSINKNKKDPKDDSFFFLSSPAFNLKISGNFLEKNLNGLLKTKFRGFLECDILELKNLYKSLISKSDSFSSKLRYNGKSIKLSSEFYNDGKNIDLKKIIIISDIANGSGDVYLGLSDNIFTTDINLEFDDLDLDSIWSTENPAKKIAEKKESQNLIENAQLSADANELKPKESEEKIAPKPSVIKVRKRNISDLILEARDYDINMEIYIKNATLYEGQVKDIKFYANIANDNKILISPLSFKLPGNSEFRANGIFEESNMSSKFTGNIDGKGESLSELFKWLQVESNNIKIDNLKNYALYGDLEITPNLTSLKNFYINLDDKKTEFYGNLEINDSEKNRFVNTNIQISEFDFEKYISFSKNNSYLSEGILFDKLLWLNQVYSNYSIKLKFDKLIYADQEFKNQNINLDFGQGYIKVPKTHFDSEKNIFDFEFNVDISDKNQVTNLKLNADKLKLKLKDEDDPLTKVRGLSLFDKFYKLPSLQGFTGAIDLTANEITLDDKLISNFDYKNSFKNGVFGQSKLTMQIYDGTFEYKGLSDIKYNKIINGLFSCKSCNVNKILNDFYNVKAINGITNLSGNIVSIAKSVDEFKNNLNSEINIAISAPKIDGYGLNELVKKMFSVKKFANELADPEKILENKELSTQFVQGKGFVNLKGAKNSNFSVSLSGPAINSVFSGIIFLNDESINGTLNTIFLSGTLEKKIPINIATNIFGFFDDVGHVSNLNQARQYLGLERINNQELNAKLLTKSEEKKVTKKNRDIAKKTPEKNESAKTENKIIEEDKQASQPVSPESKTIENKITEEDMQPSSPDKAPDKEDIISETILIEDNASKNNLDNKITAPELDNSSVVVQPSF
jgi:hypothetical protein